MNPVAIDVLVAELCMDHAICTCDPERPAPRFSAETGNCLTCACPLGGNYSTSPIGSKQLRDKMRADGWFYNLSSPMMGGGFVAQFVKNNERFRPRLYVHPDGAIMDASSDVRVYAGKYEADTEETAFALAAILAKQSEREHFS